MMKTNKIEAKKAPPSISQPHICVRKKERQKCKEEYANVHNVRERITNKTMKTNKIKAKATPGIRQPQT